MILDRSGPTLLSFDDEERRTREVETTVGRIKSAKVRPVGSQAASNSRQSRKKVFGEVQNFIRRTTPSAAGAQDLCLSGPQ